MTLIACPECGRQVSNQATSCPACAYPIRSTTPLVGATADLPLAELVEPIEQTGKQFEGSQEVGLLRIFQKWKSLGQWGRDLVLVVSVVSLAGIAILFAVVRNDNPQTDPDLAAALVAASNSVSVRPSWRPTITDGTAYERYAEKLVLAQLKDPESAKFTEERVHQSEARGIVVCGYVNAKNSFGGYIGPRAFFTTGPAEVLIEGDEGRVGFHLMFQRRCGG